MHTECEHTRGLPQGTKTHEKGDEVDMGGPTTTISFSEPYVPKGLGLVFIMIRGTVDAQPVVGGSDKKEEEKEGEEGITQMPLKRI